MYTLYPESTNNSYDACLSVSDWLHPVWHLQVHSYCRNGTILFSFMAESFCSVYIYVCTASPSSTPLLMEVEYSWWWEPSHVYMCTSSPSSIPLLMELEYSSHTKSRVSPRTWEPNRAVCKFRRKFVSTPSRAPPMKPMVVPQIKSSHRRLHMTYLGWVILCSLKFRFNWVPCGFFFFFCWTSNAYLRCNTQQCLETCLVVKTQRQKCCWHQIEIGQQSCALDGPQHSRESSSPKSTWEE